MGSGSLLEPAPFCFPCPMWGWLWVSFLSALPEQVGLGGGVAGEQGWVGTGSGGRHLAQQLMALQESPEQLVWWKNLWTSSGSPHKLANQGLEGGAEAAPRPLMSGGQTATISGAEGKAGPRGQDTDS